MERLTEHHYNKTVGAYMVCSGACIDDDFDCNDCKKLAEIVDRLAAYEDTGLEPEEVTAIKCALMGQEIAKITEFDGISVKHLIELAQAEKDGRLVVLPCKPDDTFFQWKKGDNIPTVSRFEGVAISEDGEITYPMTRWGEIFTLDDFGKTVFLTREEAEAALEREKKK